MALRKIYGRRTVLEALRSSSVAVEKIILAKGGHGSILQELADQAQTRGITIEWMDRRRLDKWAGPVVHQGVLAVLKSQQYATLDELLDRLPAHGSEALLVVADEITDPRNLGALVRCAEGAGAQGLVIPTHRSAELSEIAIKASGGATEHLPVAKVVNFTQALGTIKRSGLWVAGLDAAEGQDLWLADLRRPLVLVVGSEGKGLRRLTRESCDMLLRIPMAGEVQSLNAAVAAGIALYEIQRQRRCNASGS